ncbi:uncharacterized protein LOC113291140 [Papaver somniferum]|uniref:uncharacterized protein LOC113291140 n=1 Tax=Papaver somniferum TaxID=3469 RepID=UPI000E6F632D|nr:uncharacterized protein LOC113291140 [Papaver somniferum]
MSKCIFGKYSLDYLGHIITAEGVSADPSKIECMKKWPLPKTIKDLRWFLSLTGYYGKIVQGYSSISKPLTNLLKKNALHWNQAATTEFENLRTAIRNTPVLALPDFTKPFVV